MTASCESRTASPSRPESPFPSWSFVGILLAFLLPTYTDACADPPRFNTMALQGPSKDTYHPGDKVEYRCRPGYRRSSSLPMSSVCQPDGTWMPLLQEACTAKRCPQLSEPLNGQVDGSFLFGSQAYYTCNEGYYLIGKPVLHCDLSGNDVDWDATPPQCEKILCQPPKQIQNGITSSQKETYEYNEVVTYRCVGSSGGHEYSLIGESRLICSGHNEWSSDPPECKVVVCQYPVLKNGVVVSGQRKFYYKATVKLGCQEGFYLQGSEIIVCGANSTWEPELPQCIKGPVSTTRPPSTDHTGPTSTTSAPPSETPSGKLGGGEIAAIVLSVFSLIALIVGCLLCRHKKKKGKTEASAAYSMYQDKAASPAEQTH